MLNAPILNYCFPKRARLLRSSEFRLCSKGGTQRTGRYLHLEVFQSSSRTIKLGLTVSRRYGKAIQRNRFKRLMREVFRLCQHDLPVGIYLNVRPRQASLHASFAEIRQEFMELITRTSNQKLNSY